MSEPRWLPVRFRGEEVLAECDAAGGLKADAAGFVAFRYKPGGKVYRSRPERFEPVAGASPVAPPEPAPAAPPSPGGGGARARAGQGVRLVDLAGRRDEAVTVQIWTDGACSGNPGPAGAGVHYRFAGEVKEISEYLGQGTNNIAELVAIARGLELVADPTQPVDVMSDSDYSIKVIAGVYKAKKNQELIARIQQALRPFTDLQLVKVPGHAGVAGNERADELARLAISRQASWRG